MAPVASHSSIQQQWIIFQEGVLLNLYIFATISFHYPLCTPSSGFSLVYSGRRQPSCHVCNIDNA